MPLTETANAVLNAMRRKPYLTEKHVALGIEQKQQIVAEVNEVAASALSAVLADYRGLTVAEMTEMRVKARESGVYLRVVRNTLAKRAVEVLNTSA